MLGLRRSLIAPKAALGEVLAPVSALRELAGVADASARGQGLTNVGDRASLAGDCQAALDKLGPEAKSHLGPRLTDFRRTILVRLGDLLSEPAGSRRAAEAARAMVVALREAGAARAAWDDCVRAFQSGEPLSTGQLRIAQLREVLEARGHDWSAQASKLSELVGDGDFEFARDLAGFPTPPPPDAVWIGFLDAFLPEGYLRRGAIQFFGSTDWPEVAREADAETGEARAPELDDELLNALKLERQDYFVWARVELTGAHAREPGPDVPRLPPAGRARELAAAVVEAATFRLGGSAWKCQLGAVTVQSDGRWETVGRFEDPVRRRLLASFRAPSRDETSGALGAIPTDFVDALAAGSVAAREAVAEVRWYEAAEAAQEPAQQLALHVRGLEHALPVVGSEMWTDPVRRYLREHWVHDVLTEIVFAIGARAASELQGLGDGVLDEFEQFVVYDDATRSHFNLSPSAVVRNARAISERLPKDMWELRRSLREVAQATETHDAALVWLDSLGQAFDTYLNRAVRQRNAILHGMAIDPDVVDSVVPFVSRLSAYVVAQAAHNVTSGLHPLADLERGRNEGLMTRRELEDARRPVWQILWSPREDETF
jgi:hypothetical protein